MAHSTRNIVPLLIFGEPEPPAEGRINRLLMLGISVLTFSLWVIM